LACLCGQQCYVANGACIRSVLGDFPLIELEGTNSLLARLLFVSYMVILFFVVLNMFIAVLTEVAHVYSLRPSLDEYREWIKMKRLLLELFCCCFGYGQNGDSVIDDDSDDEADLAVEEEALAAYGEDRANALRDRLKEKEAIRKTAEEAREQGQEISEAAKLNQRMEAVENALSTIGDVIMEKQARKQERKREKEQQSLSPAQGGYAGGYDYGGEYAGAMEVQQQQEEAAAYGRSPEYGQSPERERPRRPASRAAGARRPSKMMTPRENARLDPNAIPEESGQ